MKNTKILYKLIEEENWDEIISFSLEEETKDLFLSWLDNKSNEPDINSLIKKIPDAHLESLIINFPSELISFLINNYKPEYSELAYKILKKEMERDLDYILPLLDIKLIKIIFESLIQEKSIEELNTYLYIKYAEKDTYNYKNILLKILRSKQSFFDISNIIARICNFSRKRKKKLSKK